MTKSIQAYLEPLRPYAVEPLASAPPELLPLESSDPWSIGGASRQALGMLLAGEQPGPRLYALADYLLTYITPADMLKRSVKPWDWFESFAEAILLNGTALALCGYLCEGKHPEAEIWRQTGCARLVTEAHRRKAALEDRALATCLMAVCQVADELELPILSDMITLRERMWGRLLDHSRAERLHVSPDEYLRQMKEPVPFEQLGALLRKREWQEKARSPRYMNQADMEDADQTLNNLLTLRAHMLVRYQFGSDVDWHLRIFDDVESTVSLNMMAPVSNLVSAFAETGKAVYGKKAVDLMWSWYRQAPMPNHRQMTGPWRTLEVGGRPWRLWVDALGYMGKEDFFTDETHAMLALSRLEHIRYLLAYSGPPMNWYQVECSGLAVSALYSPELKLADAYLRIALRRLKWINSFAYFDDGFQFELTQGYHIFPTNAIFSVVNAASARNVPLPEDYLNLVAKAHEMYLFTRQPDNIMPMFNDCNPVPTDPAENLRFAAEIFKRNDFLWGGTHGKEGQPPDHASHAWHAAGYYAMRDKWGEDGQFLFFDGAPWGAAHQHEDKLTFTLYSHGRLLIGDPNIYSYSPTELTHYFRSSRGHNVVMVDGKGQARRFRQDAWTTTLGKNEWVSQPDFDFVSSEYLEGFAPDLYSRKSDPSEVDFSVSHRRAIFYVKPGYWILSDLLKSTDQEAHTLEQIFHFAPVMQTGQPEPMRPGEVNVSSQAAVSCNEGVANIAVIPVDSEGLEARAEKGQTSPAVGWYGVLGEYPAWDVTFQKQTTLPARMDAVLFPLAAGESDYPQVTRLRADEQVTAFRIQGAGVDDLFILCEEGTGAVTVDGVTFEGRALLLRREPGLKALAVDPMKVQVNGQDVEIG